MEHDDEARTHSVVIPTHDRPELLADAVRSVLAQRRVSLECIVVDDGGSHQPPIFEDERVRVIRHDEPRGPGAARNTGIDAARGRFISFLDDDDLYEPTRLADAEAYVGSDLAIVCWSRSLDGGPPVGRLLFGNVADSILDDSTPQIGTVTIARGACPRFDEELRLNQDVEWWLRAAQACSFLTIPYALHRLREHEGTRVTNDGVARERYSALLMRKHAAYFASHPRARAFRYRRMALVCLAGGRHADGVAHMARSFRARPSAKSALHVLRSVWLMARAQVARRRGHARVGRT